MDYRLTLDSVQLDELGELIDGPPRLLGHLDCKRGEILVALDDEPESVEDDVEDEDEDWIPIEGEGSSAAYGDMADFADAVGDPQLAARLSDALGGKGALRRFRDAVHDTEDETGRLWHEYSVACASQRAIDWLLDRDLIDPTDGRQTGRAFAEMAEAALEAVAIISGPTVALPEVATRWNQIAAMIDEGESVVITRDGSAWALLSPADRSTGPDDRAE